MAIVEGFGQKAFLVLSMREFNSKTTVLHCVRIIPNSGRKIPVSFFTKPWFPSSSSVGVLHADGLGTENSMDLLHGRFHSIV